MEGVGAEECAVGEDGELPVAYVGEVYAEGAAGLGREDGFATEGIGGAGGERGGVVVEHVEACAAVQKGKL